jgi:hypothetical protein
LSARDANLIGVTPSPRAVGLAGGERRRGFYCLAYLQQIEDHTFPPPGIEATLILQGSSDHGLLGLEILKHLIAKFDGPKESLTLISQSLLRILRFNAFLLGYCHHYQFLLLCLPTRVIKNILQRIDILVSTS